MFLHPQFKNRLIRFVRFPSFWVVGNPRDFPSINMMCSGFGFGLTDFQNPAAIPLRPFDTFIQLGFVRGDFV